MPSQVVAAATQFRKASGLDELEELDELDDDPHMPISAWRQLELVRELVLDVDIPKHVWHLAMMLSTALSHLDVALGQPVTDSTDNTNAMKAIFMRSVYPRSSWRHTPQNAPNQVWCSGRARIRRLPTVVVRAGRRFSRAVASRTCRGASCHPGLAFLRPQVRSGPRRRGRSPSNTRRPGGAWRGRTISAAVSPPVLLTSMPPPCARTI